MLIDEEKDDEIDFDFGKIKNFFKGKKKSNATEAREEAREEAKEIKQEIKEEIKELKREEKEVEIIEKTISKDPQKAKERLDDVKEEIENDDENLNIDFSKVKGWVKKLTAETDDNAPKEKEKTNYKSDSDEDISFDFKKVKGFFKGLKEKTKEDNDEGDEDVSFDFKAASGFFKKYSTFLLLLIPLIICIYLRAMPAYLPATDDWAESSVYSTLKNQIENQVDQQYPNLPDANKAPLVEKEFENFISQNKQQINQQIDSTSEFFKSRMKNDKGQTYLLAIDPYYWLRQAENIVDHGYPGDEMKDGVQWDNHMLAPTGRPSDTSFHAYIEAYLFKFLRIFNGDLELITVAFYIPIIICALSVIPAFFLARKAGGDFGGLIAGLIIAIHPSFLTRTVGGFSDTDAYNVMFPLFIAWFFLEAFETKDMKKKLIFSGLAGLFTGLFAFTWQGWWYIFDFIIIAAVVYTGFYILRGLNESRGDLTKVIFSQDMKNTAILILTFIVFSGVFVSIFSGAYAFKSAPLQPLNFMKIKQVATYSVWPNVFTTVAEQNEASLGDIINSSGGSVLFLMSMVGILLTLAHREIKRRLFILCSIIWYGVVIFYVNDLHTFLILLGIPIVIRIFLAIKDKEKGIDVKYAVLLIIWFVATIYASTKGVRFTLLLVPAFGIALGVCFGVLFRTLSQMIEKGIHINKNITKIIVIVVLGLFLIGPYNSAKSVAKNEVPSADDAWWASLEKIKMESSPDAIINSWWDFGHWFKYIADRAVTFDGTTQETPQAHWIGNSLLTGSEEEAVGILRMVDCSGHWGGTYAFDEIDSQVKDIPKSVDIVYDIIVLDKEDARKKLEEYGLTNIDKILEYTHCTPPEDYFITSEDMVSKAGVWGHFGSWDFNKALMYYTINKKGYRNNEQKSVDFLKQRFGISDNEAESIYDDIISLETNKDVNDWIAPWPGYASELTGCSVNGEIVQCGNGLVANLTDHDALFPTQQGIKRPNSFIYAEEGGIKRVDYEEDTVGVSAVLIPSGDGYNSILTSPLLADSMFTRLFYMEGHGLKYFDKFSDERTVFGQRIIVWKVDWDGKDNNVMDEFKKPVEEEKEVIDEEVIDGLVEEINESEDTTESVEEAETNESEG